MEELQKLYNVLSRDGFYTKSFEEFQQQYSDPAYAERVFGVVSREGYFTGDKDAFLSKYPISGGGQPTVTETVTETVVEEPKKKGFFQQQMDEAIATASASTSEEQPSSSDSQETALESLERTQREIEQTLNITPSTEQADDAFVPTPEGVATQDVGTAFTPTIQAPLEDVSQETADAQDAGQQAAVQVEIGQYELNQEEARKMNESEGIENFQVETIESDAAPQYDFGSKTFVQTKDNTYVAYPEGMTLEQAREEGKVMEFTTEEQAKYFAKGGWKDKDAFIGTALGETPLAGQDAAEQRINMLTDDFFKETQDSRKNQLESLFSDYGFTFEVKESFGTRRPTEMIVTAPDGETYEMSPSQWSRYFESNRVSEARMFRDFMRRNIKEAKTSVEGYAAQINKAKNLFKGEQDIENARVIFNEETNEFMSEVGSFAQRQSELEAQGEMFNNYTLRQINANPELKAKYSEFEQQVKSIEAEAAKLQERQNFFIKKGADLDKMVASYDFLQSQKGNYRTGIFKALLRGIANTASGFTAMVMDLGFESEDEIEGGTITNPNTGETQLVGKKLRAQFTSEYAVDLFQEDPDKYYFGGSDASIKMFFGEDGTKAVDIIESGNLNEENSKFLSEYLKGLGADRADRFLNNFRVKGTAEEGDRITNVSGYSYTTGGSDDIGLGDAIKDDYKDLSKKYTKYYSDTGPFDRALDRYLEQGTLARFAPNAFSAEASQSMLDKGIVDAISDALPTMAFGSNTEQWEEMQKEGFWGGAILGAFESLPQMIGGNWAGRTAKMFAYGASHVDKEIRTNPETANMTENEKYKLIVPIGIANAVLEEVGVRSILNNKNVLHNVVKNSMLKSGKSTTASQFSNIVKGEVDNVLARGGIVLGRAGLVEFETGALQELSTVGIKEIYNISKDKEMFETPGTFKELVGQVLYAGAQEAVGGFIMGTPNAISAAAKKNAIPSITDEQFKIFEAIVADDTYQQMYETRLKQRVAAGEITQQQAIEEKKEFGAIAQASLKIPSDYTTAQKKEALGLLLEKQRIESSIEDKSSELTKKQQGKLRDIDGQLESIQTRAIEQEQSQRESEAAIPDIAQKEEQEKQQEMYDNAVTEQEKRDVEEMFGVPEGEMEGRKGPNIFINKKGERTSEMTAEQEVMRGRVIEMAAKAAKAISKVIPDTNIVLYETTAEFQNATGRQGRGFFGFDGTVHINLEQATETTIPHEIMHAVLFDKFGSKDPNDTQQIAMAKAATQMVSSVRKTIDAGSELAKRLDAFASKYEAGVQNEEQLSELFGIMASEYTSLKPRSRSAIVNFFKDIAKRFGIDLGPKFGQNDADVVQLMNTLSRKVRTGETIVEEDVTALDDISVLKDTAPYSGEGVALELNPNNTTPKKVDGRESKSIYAKVDGYGELPVVTIKEFVDSVNGQLFAVTSDATKVGKDSKGNPIDGGFGNLAHEKNLQDGVGFASKNNTAISGSVQKIMNQYPAGTKVGVMVMIQNPTATLGNQYGGRYLHRILTAAKESDPDGYADFVKDINDYVDSKSDLAAYRDSKGDFFALLDDVEGISEVEFGLQFAKSAGFELTRPFMKSIIPETAKIGTKKSLNGSINKRIQDLGFNQLDFLMEYGDVELLGEENLLGTNEIGTRLNDKGGNVVGGFIITVPTKAEKQKFIDDAQKKGFNHPQFSVKWGSEGNFIFDGLYNIDDNFMRFGKPQKVLDTSKFTVEQRDAAVREQYTNDKNYLTKHRSKPLSERTYTHLTIESKGEFKRDNPEMFIEEYKSIAPGIAQGKGVVFETLPTAETEYTKTGRRQMGEFESKSPIDEFGDIDGYAMEQAYDLANSRGIRIGRLKELSNVVTNAEGNIVGATFTDYTDGVYSFDIVVDESVEGQGVGTLLLEDAMYPPFDIQDMDPNVKTRIEVVNPVMQSMLEGRGFRVTKKLGPDSVIMEPAPVRGREQMTEAYLINGKKVTNEEFARRGGMEVNQDNVGDVFSYVGDNPQAIRFANDVNKERSAVRESDSPSALRGLVYNTNYITKIFSQAYDKLGARSFAAKYRNSINPNLTKDLRQDPSSKISFGERISYNIGDGALAQDVLGAENGIQKFIDFAQSAKVKIVPLEKPSPVRGREQKQAPSQKYPDDVALRIIKENNALDNPMSTGCD
jgi:hypothetical protein